VERGDLGNGGKISSRESEMLSFHPLTSVSF